MSYFSKLSAPQAPTTDTTLTKKILLKPLHPQMQFKAQQRSEQTVHKCAANGVVTKAYFYQSSAYDACLKPYSAFSDRHLSIADLIIVDSNKMSGIARTFSSAFYV